MTIEQNSQTEQQVTEALYRAIHHDTPTAELPLICPRIQSAEMTHVLRAFERELGRIGFIISVRREVLP